MTEIKLPPLPHCLTTYEFPDGAYSMDEMQAYATAAIEADRQSQERKISDKEVLSVSLAVIAERLKDKEDAERYRWLRNRASAEGICGVHRDYWSDEYRGQAHCEVYDGEFLDKEIDHTRRAEDANDA